MSARGTVDYGKAIRVLRAIRGFSQQELARRSWCDPSQVSLIESGRRSPSVERLEAFAKALGCEVLHIVLLGTPSRQVPAPFRSVLELL